MQARRKQTESLFAARITPAGRGAIAVIAVSGSDDVASTALRASFRPFRSRTASSPTRAGSSPQITGEEATPTAMYGQWGSEPAEDVMVCRPESCLWEIHCHGGEAACRRILDDLSAAGCTIGTSSDWMMQRRGRLFAEQQEALGTITTTRAAVHLVPQLNGVFQSFVEAAIRCKVLSELQERLLSALRWRVFTSRLLKPPVVAILGRPNAGKSSLMNRMLGLNRAIVSAVAGTTRDVVSSHGVFDGWGVELADTAGLREQTSDELEREGQSRALRRAADADLTLLVIDQSEPLHADDLRRLQTHDNAIVVLNKLDLPSWLNSTLDITELHGRTVCPVSSLTGQGIEELQTTLVQRLFPEEPPPGTPLATSPRQWDVLHRAWVAACNGDVPQTHALLHELI